MKAVDVICVFDAIREQGCMRICLAVVRTDMECIAIVTRA